jgi:hypothetical protein
MADIMHPTYMPFSEDQLRSHFAAVKQKGQCTGAKDKHVYYYRKRIRRYEDYLLNNPDRKREPLNEVRGPCQIEKDERFWTASCLMNVFYHRDREGQFTKLFQKAYGREPPIDIGSWEECLEGELYLFFEPNLPSPLFYKEWLRQNLGDRHLIPYILNSDNGRKNLEGPTNADALLINRKNGFAVVIEAKVLSDIACQITYDVMRNQIARNVDVMLEKNTDLCPPLDKRDPAKTLFLLLTPDILRGSPGSRLYGYKFNEYKSDPSSLARDLPHRKNVNWENLSKKLGWLTWEDFKQVNRNCCVWL